MNLPTKLTLLFTDLGIFLDADDQDVDADELDESILNYLSDTYGFCVNSYRFLREGDKLKIFDIDRDITE